MGGKSSAPATPDYVGATQLQGEISKENLATQNYANRPNIYTPWGSSTWQTGQQWDPQTNQNITTWYNTTKMDPALQNALDSQIKVQSGRSDLANQFMGRVANEYSQPFDWSGLPQSVELNDPAELNGNLADYSQGLQSSFNFGGPQMNLQTQDNPALPQFDSSYRDTVANQLFQKMQPVHERQQNQLETKLANQGFQIGTEGYTRALGDLQQRQAQERFNALDSAGQEAQRLYGMQMGSRQQAFNEDVGSGNFANQAVGQQFQQNMGAANFSNQSLGQAAGMDMNRMNAMNSATAQQQALNQQFGNYQNQLRQQAIAEQMQRRGMSLNEMNALLTGQQVGMPQMPNFNQAGVAQTPNIVGALAQQYQGDLSAVNAANAQNANMWGGLGSLASTAFMFSDRRLKSNIKRVGEHPIGVGIYEYTMMGMPQRGVIAQEVQAVRPDLVKRHASGYLMVNYGGL